MKLDGGASNPVKLVETLNELGGKHAVGQVDLVENRLVGMKSPRRVRDARRHDPDDAPTAPWRR